LVDHLTRGILAAGDAGAQSEPLARAHENWLGLPTTLRRLPGDIEATDVVFLHPALVVARSGRGRRWFKCGLHRLDLYSAPRMAEMYGEGFHLDHAQWEGEPGEVIAIQFPIAMVNRLLEVTGQSFALPTRHEVFDDQLTELAFSLWKEAERGSPCGALYTQGLTLALLGLLMEQHGASSKLGAKRVCKFSPQERSRLRSFIVQEISGNLSVERLAAIVGMSPHYFSRVFKASFDCSPHDYVLEQRIDLACKALRLERDRPLADIAHGTGFSSQSHFTEVFRRRIGTTPARWRSAG
jgi:AraC family transcriptional regulator